MSYWLLKSEPSTYGIDDLSKAPKKTAGWDGIRNYQARNYLRDEMRKGDQAFFYHSSCDVPGIAGIVSVVREAYPDASAFKKDDDHYDAGSDPENPRWFAVDIRLERKFTSVIALDELRRHERGPLKEMVLLKRGNRLSVMPVTNAEWRFILTLADAK